MVSKQWLVVRDARENHIKLVGGRLPLGGTALPPTPSPKGTHPKTPSVTTPNLLFLYNEENNNLWACLLKGR